jgi:chaperone required for assembly of F1-ATPase
MSSFLLRRYVPRSLSILRSFHSRSLQSHFPLDMQEELLLQKMREGVLEEKRKEKERSEFLMQTLEKLMTDPELTPQKGDHETIQKRILEDAREALSDESSKWGRQSTPLFTRDDRNHRFYRSVAIEEYDFEGRKGYVVRIGQEQYLRSNITNNVVIIPNLHLANAIAGEWELQQEYIRPNTLPLSDIMIKVQNVSDLPVDIGSKLKKTIIDFFDAEYICHREGMGQRPQIEQHWNPLVRWFESTYNAKLNVFGGQLFAPDPTQYEARAAFVQNHTNKQDDFKDKKKIMFDLSTTLDKLKPDELAIIHGLVETTESAVISLALFHEVIDYEEAILATQWPLLEQTAEHGIVMGDHDVIIAEQRLKIAALALFKKLYNLKE